MTAQGARSARRKARTLTNCVGRELALLTADAIADVRPVVAQHYRDLLEQLPVKGPNPDDRKDRPMLYSLAALLAQAPAVHPSNPPGYDRVTTLVDWTAKLAITACVVGIIVTAGTLAVQHHRGTLGPDTGGRLGVVLGSCVLIGVASQLVNSLV